VNRKQSEKPEILNEYEKYIMQLYRALNRQYSKEDAINVVVNFIYKKLGYSAMYFDVIEDNKIIMLKESSSKYINQSSDTGDKINSGAFNFNLHINKYKKQLCLEDLDSIREAFPYLSRMINPCTLLSTPVFTQSKLVGILVIYEKKKNTKLLCEFKNLVQLIARELTAVFSRIERQNLAFENMLGLTALENILLYNPEDNLANTDDPLNKMVLITSRTTGMKKCTIALIDENREFLLPHYSTFDTSHDIKEKKYPLDRNKTKDHTAIIAIETKKPVVVYDALTDPRCDPKIAEELGIYSNITVPILNAI